MATASRYWGFTKTVFNFPRGSTLSKGKLKKTLTSCKLLDLFSNSSANPKNKTVILSINSTGNTQLRTKLSSFKPKLPKINGIFTMGLFNNILWRKKKTAVFYWYLNSRSPRFGGSNLCVGEKRHFKSICSKK